MTGTEPVTQSAQFRFDPFDARMTDHNRFEFYRQARDQQPFLLNHGPRRIWSVFRYDDIVEIVRNHDAFPSVPDFKGSFAILFDDPPEHTRLRSVVDEAFGRQKVEELRLRIATVAENLLREAMLRYFLVPAGTSVKMRPANTGAIVRIVL